MSFCKWWVGYKLPDVGSLRRDQFEALRRIAQAAYTAGKKAERKVLTERRPT